MALTTTSVPAKPVIFFIFGATGDLTSRKLIPALYNLFLEKWMPANFAIIGMGRTPYTDETFRLLLAEKIKGPSGSDKANDNQWSEFAQHIHYHNSEISDDTTYSLHAEWIRKLAQVWDDDPCLIYYMAVAPRFFGTIAEKLAKHKLTANADSSRVVIEKPFGHDLESARALNRLLSSVFSERQIYRIDHYLGKETVQNIQAFRFANSILEPVWNRNYIDHVQISVTEQLGVEGRGGYYEEAGALRDMVQNHIPQLLCLVAMEPPVKFYSR